MIKCSVDCCSTQAITVDLQTSEAYCHQHAAAQFTKEWESTKTKAETFDQLMRRLCTVCGNSSKTGYIGKFSGSFWCEGCGDICVKDCTKVHEKARKYDQLAKALKEICQ